MNKLCNKQGCRELTKLKEKYCDKHKVIELENVKRWRKAYDEKRQDDKYKKFYKSSRWKFLRSHVLKRDNYVCQECIKENKLTVCSTVHHIVSIKEDFSKALDEDNLITLCHECHNKIHERFRGRS